MKKSIKQKLSLFLAIAMVLTMAIPTGLMASAAPVTALEEDVTNKIIKSTFAVNNNAGAFGGEGIEMVLDGNDATKYCGRPEPKLSESPMVFTWEMTEAVAVQTIALTTAADAVAWPGRFPQSWNLFGSTDGTTWSAALTERENQTGLRDSAPFLYTFDNTTAYKYYKFEVIATRDDDLVSFAELQLSTKKYPYDEDTDPVPLAEAFDAKLAAQLTGFTYTLGDTAKQAQVEALRAEYKILPSAAKDLLANIALLEDAEVLVYDTELAALEGFTYAAGETAKENKIAALRAGYNALPANVRGRIASTGVEFLVVAEVLIFDAKLFTLDGFTYTLGDTAKEAQVAGLRTAYNALSNAVRGALTNGGLLTDAEALIVTTKIAQLAGFTYNGEVAKKTLVEGLRADYTALSTGARGKVTNVALVDAAEKAIYEYEITGVLGTMIDDIETDVAAMADSGEFDYHINGEITRAISIYNSLSAAQQATITNYGKLAIARAEMDDQINNSFNVSITGWNNPDRATRTPWVMSYNDIQQAESQQAVADELKYQYSRLGSMSSTYVAADETQLTADWGDMMMIQFDDQPNDNIGNPWGQAGRRWGYVAIPFAGMAFSSTGYFSQQENRPAISNVFHMNGNVYIQYWEQYRVYKYQPIDIEATRPNISTISNFPGSDGAEDATKNSFRYAYAKYNSDAKVLDNDEVVGIPSGFVQTSGTAMYQKFTSPTGDKYIVGSSAAINAAEKDRPEDTQIAFVIDDATVTAITALGSGDFAAGLAQVGAPISALENNEQFFELAKAIHNTDGTVAFEAIADWEIVVILINAIPNPITKDNYYADAMAGTVNTNTEDAVTNAETAYNALSAADKALVTNYNKLTNAKAQIATVIADRTAGLAVRDLINALPEAITLADEPAIVAARTAYTALTSAQNWYVDNIFDLGWAETELNKRKAEAFDARIDALISVEDLTALKAAGPSAAYDAAEAAIRAVEADYEALPSDIQRYIAIDMYDKLYELIDILDDSGLRGDLDGNGTVNLADIVMMRNWIMDGAPSADQIAKGDLDGNGSINLADIVALRNIIMGVAG